MAVKKENFRRLLLSFEALADLGPVLAGESDFGASSRTMLRSIVDAVGAREGALFAYGDRPTLLHSLAVHGFAFPEPALIPLLPRHVHALTTLREPDLLGPGGHTHDRYFTANGNLAPELFKCVSSLRVGGRLVGAIALGRRHDDAEYTTDEVTALGLLTNYVSIAVHNHGLAQSLEQRVAENLRLLASMHNFYDTALEAFAGAIDIKHVNTRGHSLRVGKYAGAIAQSMGLEAGDVSGIRAAGYLHDIGKVAVDKRLFGKPSKLDADEMREMADHTTIGHRIVNGAQFPWPMIPAVVRWHHERADGSGYPDRLHMNDTPLPARIMAVADTFDAMVTDRPYREGMSVGEAVTEIVRITPQKFDPAVVHGLMVQLRRDAAGSNQSPFLDERVVCNLAPTDIDQLASMLNFRTTAGRVYSA